MPRLSTSEKALRDFLRNHHRLLALVMKDAHSLGRYRLKFYASDGRRKASHWPIDIAPEEYPAYVMALHRQGFDVRGRYDFHIFEWEKLHDFQPFGWSQY